MIGDLLRAILSGPVLYKICSGILLLLVLAWMYWGAKIGQHQEAERNQQIESIQKTGEETKQLLLRQLEQADSINYSRLMQKYPLGYCLFAIDHKKIIIPYKSRLESDYEIDWSKAKVSKLTSEEVAIRLPDIHDKVHHIIITGIAVGNTRRVGSIREHFGGPGPQIFTEVVADSEKGVIIALGFK